MENARILIYQVRDRQTSVEVRLDQDTVWLTQAQIIDLFESSKSNISEHIKHIFKSGELHKEATVRKFRTVRQEGRRVISRDLEHYNLDMIISIGYRVNSIKGTQFRIWANSILKDYLTKGYAIDQKRFQEQSSQPAEFWQRLRTIIEEVVEQKASSMSKQTLAEPSAEEAPQVFRPS